MCEKFNFNFDSLSDFKMLHLDIVISTQYFVAPTYDLFSVYFFDGRTDDFVILTAFFSMYNNQLITSYKI